MNMDTISTGTLAKLKEIMRRNKEVEKAYHHAANRADNKKLIHYFGRKSKEWKNFGEALKSKVRAALPARGEQKVAMDVMEMPSLDNGATTLNRFSQRERAEVEEYRKILEEQKLPFDIYHLIRIHKMWIEVDLSKSML